MNYVSRCEPVYSKKSDILRNNYLVSLTASRCWGLHFVSHTCTYIYLLSFSCVTFKKKSDILFFVALMMHHITFMKNEYSTQSGFKRKIDCNSFPIYFLVQKCKIKTNALRCGLKKTTMLSCKLTRCTR